NTRSVGYPPGVRIGYPQNPVRPNDCQCSSLGSQRKTFIYTRQRRRHRKCPTDEGRIAMATENRGKALEAARAQIDKQYGKGSVMRLGEEVRAPIEVIPTGSIALDVALGIGGLPGGRGVGACGRRRGGRPHA